MSPIPEVSKEALQKISAQQAFELNILPLKLIDDTLFIGTPTPDDTKLIDDLSFYTGMKIETTKIPAEIIVKELKKHYPNFEKSQTNNLMSQANYEYSTVDLVNKLIAEAIKISASDIHFEIYEEYLRVRYRVDGHLREVMNSTREKSLAIISRIKVIAELDISEKRKPQDGKIKFKFLGREVDIRVSTLPTRFGEKVVLRILDRSQLNLQMEKLGLSDYQLNIITKHLSRPYGMILVTGPTGSGKTTTLYAALQKIHSEDRNILTVEDPVEYNLPGVNQCNVKPDIGFDFAAALRSFLRQDPDIIMVGEIRDKETAEIAIRAALTGHLVFSTLHTNDSISAITRLVDMGIEPYLVGSSLKLIIAQRLVRVLCDCKTMITKAGVSSSENMIYQKKGCYDCSFTGYKGRIAIFELFEVSEEIAEMISAQNNIESIKKYLKKSSFKSLRDAGLEKINSGITSYEEVNRETFL